jgi:hypothetical protein
MTDVRSMFDKRFLGAWDCPDGKDVVLVIERCEAQGIKGTSGEEKKAPVLYFSNTKNKKGFVLNVTNAKTLIKLFGAKIEGWPGKRIAIYAARTMAFGEEVDCLRIRPTEPAAPSAKREIEQTFETTGKLPLREAGQEG